MPSDHDPERLVLRIAELERRMSLLEHGRYGSTVTGWSAAARLLQVSVPTVRRWFKTDPRFPRPDRVRTIRRGDEVRTKPEWKMTDLTSYRA